jgi:CBS domain-containing protein
MVLKKQENRRESGLPGGGAGRKEEIGGSGVYPMSGPHPPGDAPLVGQAGWGQGQRGAAGYEDHGESEIIIQGATPERCRDIMTKDPVCCLPTNSVAQAAQLMMQYDTGLIPVVANLNEKKLLGVLTDRDLAVTVVVDSCDPARTSVESIMSRPPIVCSPDEPYEHALHTMERNRIRRVPVVDRTGRVVGIVSLADVAIRVRNRTQTAHVVQEISRRAA